MVYRLGSAQRRCDDYKVMIHQQRITGRTLQTLRARLLYDQPLCVACEAAGAVTLAQQVDHIVPLYKGGTNDDSNMQGLCIECHKAKTAKDMGHRRVTTGVDGWPIGDAR